VSKKRVTSETFASFVYAIVLLTKGSFVVAFLLVTSAGIFQSLFSSFLLSRLFGGEGEGWWVFLYPPSYFLYLFFSRGGQKESLVWREESSNKSVHHVVRIYSLLCYLFSCAVYMYFLLFTAHTLRIELRRLRIDRVNS
jgi:hypothetical protein